MAQTILVSKSLILGCAQLGMNYGVTNKHGRPTLSQSVEIIEAAIESGYTSLDTASLYGNSENVIAQSLNKIGKIFPITSKIQPFKNQNLKDIETSIRKTLDTLLPYGLNALLFHDIDDLYENNRYEIVDTILSEYKVKILLGGSCYQGYKPDRSFKSKKEILQINGSLISGCNIKNNPKILQIRAPYHQGILLINPMKESSPTWAYEGLCFLHQIDSSEPELRQAICLAYIQRQKSNSFIVVGANSAKNVKENAKAFINSKNTIVQSALDSLENIHFQDFFDKKASDPRNWLESKNIVKKFL